MICEWEGKKYIRQGECARCGMCCTGFAKPCPKLRWDTPDHCTCLIHEKEHGLGNGGVCNEIHNFPDNPGSQWHPAFKNKCGYYFTEVEHILVAAPTYDGKRYCEAEYLNAVSKLSWPSYEVYNPRTDSLHNNPNVRIAMGMEMVRERFLAGNYNRWLNLETDIIVPPNIIEVLLSFDREKKIDWISHNYPTRGSTDGSMTSGFGCTMFSKKLIEKFGFGDLSPEATTDGAYWRKVMHNCTTLDIWGIVDLRHLDG